MSADPIACPEWLSDLQQAKHSESFYRMGGQFALQHTCRGKGTLFVGFDDLSRVRTRTRIRDGWGYSFARREGWSYLGVMVFAENWFRDAVLHDALEDLARRGFFQGYEKVVFSGTSMGGFAACAFAPLAPGCLVISYSPQSTLDPQIAGWDSRYPQGAAKDWTGRFSDAATGVQDAGRVWVIYDPKFAVDHRHAMRISGPGVTHLRARYSGHHTAQFLSQIQVISKVARGCTSGSMSAAQFYNLYRRGRDFRRLQQAIVKAVIQRGKPGLQHQLMQVLQHRKRPGLVNEIRQALSVQGDRSHQ